MKLVIIASFLSIVSSAFGYETANCMGASREVDLIIVNQDVKQVRVLGSRMPLLPTRLSNQNQEGKTLYAILGSPSLLEVDNSVLTEKRGNIRLEGEELYCM